MYITLTQGADDESGLSERKTVSPCTTGDHRPTVHTQVAQHAQMALSQQLRTLRVYHAPAGWVAHLWASVSCFLMLGGTARWGYNKSQKWLCAELGQEIRSGPPLWAASVLPGPVYCLFVYSGGSYRLRPSHWAPCWCRQALPLLLEAIHNLIWPTAVAGSPRLLVGGASSAAAAGQISEATCWHSRLLFGPRRFMHGSAACWAATQHCLKQPVQLLAVGLQANTKSCNTNTSPGQSMPANRGASTSLSNCFLQAGTPFAATCC